MVLWIRATGHGSLSIVLILHCHPVLPFFKPSFDAIDLFRHLPALKGVHPCLACRQENKAYSKEQYHHFPSESHVNLRGCKFSEHHQMLVIYILQHVVMDRLVLVRLLQYVSQYIYILQHVVMDKYWLRLLQYVSQYIYIYIYATCSDG